MSECRFCGVGENSARKRPCTVAGDGLHSLVSRLPIAVLPDKRKECCCTPATCICAPKKKVDKPREPGKVPAK